MIIVKVVLIMGRNSFICILSIIPIIFIVRAIGVEIEEGPLMGDYTKRPPVPLNFFLREDTRVVLGARGHTRMVYIQKIRQSIFPNNKAIITHTSCNN